MIPATAPTMSFTSDGESENRLPLDAIFAPRTVAVIGATERQGSAGRAVLWNLISNPFGATVYPINLNRPNVLGIKAYKNIASVPDPVDLAVVITPAPTVPAVINECVKAGVMGAIVISAGFKETGPEGARLEQEVLEEARRGRMRIIGPNCVGVMRPYSGMNATFAAQIARPGSVGFISQSGALCTATLDWSFRENVGFSAFISLGSMLDVGWGDLIDYLGDDPYTKCIVIYMESIGDCAIIPFSLARGGADQADHRDQGGPDGSSGQGGRVAHRVPDRQRRGPRRRVPARGGAPGRLDLRGLRHGRGAVQAAAAQGTTAGDPDQRRRPRGPGNRRADREQGELAPISAETMAALDAILPAAWSHNNPIDILGDADPERYAKALEVTAKDPNIDGLLAILTPQAMTNPTATAEHLRQHARISGKPVLASWMGGEAVEAGKQILNQAGIPTYEYPDAAAHVFTLMWRSSYNLQGLYETPNLPVDSEMATTGGERAEAIIAAVRREGRSVLTEFESKQLLAAYGIPTVKTAIAATPDAAVAAAEDFGYPIVLKLHSKTITHKTDVGGVQLNLQDAGAVRTAFGAIESSVRQRAGAEHFQGVSVQPMIKLDGYEIIIGSSLDPQFGPVLLFGTGGQLVEVFKDRALALPPLNTTLARRMMEQTKIYIALKGVRGRRPVDLAALEQLSGPVQPPGRRAAVGQGG